jgi:hypothetical protein
VFNIAAVSARPGSKQSQVFAWCDNVRQRLPISMRYPPSSSLIHARFLILISKTFCSVKAVAL